MKKILMILFVGMFLISLVSSANPTFQVNTAYDLKRSCSNEGFFCGSSFECNITITYPTGDLVKNNILMTDQNSFYNVSVNSTENNLLGEHPVIMSCNNGTNAGLDNFIIDITADGKPFRKFPMEFMVIIFGFLLVGVGSFFDEIKLFQSIGSMILIVMGVVTLFPGYSFINWDTLTGKALGFGMMGIGFYFLLGDSFSRDKQEEFYEGGGEDEDLFR